MFSFSPAELDRPKFYTVNKFSSRFLKLFKVTHLYFHLPVFFQLFLSPYFAMRL